MRRQMWFMWLLLLVFSLGMGLASGCAVVKNCQESCTDTSECYGSLGCYDVPGQGKICIPKLCESCLTNNQSCRYSTVVDLVDQCRFVTCVDNTP